MLQSIEAKMKQLDSELERSAANHNYLIGAKAALVSLYNDLVAAAPTAEAIVATVDPAAAPEVDAAVSTVEAVAAAVE